jgi:hypothetical protein
MQQALSISAQLAKGEDGRLKVDVSRIGVSISPSSFTWVEPTTFAEGVAYENRARHLFAEEVAGMGQDGGHASAHVVATDNGRVPDLDRLWGGRNADPSVALD